MGSYREVAEHLIAISGVRDVGHTSLMINGTKSTKCVVIGHTREHAKRLAEQSAKGSIPVVMNNLIDMQGSKLPIAIDHSVTMLILRVLTSDLRELEQTKENDRRIIETLLWKLDKIEKPEPKKSITRIILDSFGSIFK